MATAAELRNLSDSDLVRRLDEAKEELFNLRFQHVTGQLDLALAQDGVEPSDVLAHVAEPGSGVELAEAAPGERARNENANG